MIEDLDCTYFENNWEVGMFLNRLIEQYYLVWMWSIWASYWESITTSQLSQTEHELPFKTLSRPILLNRILRLSHYLSH